MSVSTGPLVSIGVPTFNRADTLARTLDSALGQSHERLEVVISDNASTDGTPELCERVAARDPRVRYVRQSRNIGPTPNFNFLFGECRGDYVMMLADDDWIDSDYVTSCLAVLRANADYALVCGLARYYRDRRAVGHGVEMQLEQQSPAARVAAYYASVEDNGTYYGLMPRNVLIHAAPLPNLLGNDWLLLARVAFAGKIRTLPDVHVHRALDGTSGGVAKILQTFGSPSFQARAPHLMVAAQVLRDVGWDSDVYIPLATPTRLGLALRSAWSVIDWPSLVWHATSPTAAALARRRRGAALARAYFRVARACGAGRPSGRR